MSRPKFLPNEFIEEITTKRIREYEAKVGEAVMLPVPVEQIVEQVLGLDFDYDEIEEMHGEQILGGLDAMTRTILINTKHNDLFEKTPGLLRLLRQACAPVPMRVVGYCVMANHFHLVLWPIEDGDLSDWMQWLLTTQAHGYRKVLSRQCPETGKRGQKSSA